MRGIGLLRNLVLSSALACAALVSAASPASAVDWSDYRLGDFYDISQATDPAVRAAGRATVFFGNATGFVISPEGHVLTNHHVYETFGNGGTVYVEWKGGNTYSRSLQLSLVARSATYDVALYKANVTNLPYLKIDARLPRIGEDLFIVGHPNTRALEVSFGKLLATGLNIAGRPSIEYSTQTWWGSSGSPVCDRAGNAVAIHWGWDANRVSNGRLTGVPFNLIVRAVPQIAAVYTKYGVGAAAPSTPVTPSTTVTPTTVLPNVGTTGTTTTTPAPTSTTPARPSTAAGLPEIPVGGANSATLTRTGDLTTFRVSVAAHGDLVITLTGPSNTDFDMAVWKWDFVSSRGAKSGAADGRTSNESITVRNATPGTYLVVVNSYDGVGPFRVAARLDQQTTVGGGSTASTGTSGVIGTAVDVLRGGNDWRTYTLAAPAGSLRVTLAGPSGTDFDVYVFAGGRVDATAAVAVGDSPAAQESVTFTSQGGAYTVLVRSAAGAGRFDLTVAK